MKITTNQHVRNTIGWKDLTDVECEKFSWMKASWSYCDISMERFFRYRGDIYIPNDFERHPLITEFGWDAYQTNVDCVNSGVVIKYTDRYDELVIGRYRYE